MTTLPLLMALLACTGDTTTPTDSGADTEPTDSGGTTGDDTGTPSDTCEADEWWPDTDNDGYGDTDAASVEDCDAPGDDWVRNDRDCNDGDGDVYPGVTDTCDDADSDCDGTVDEDGDGEFVLYPDDDEDGYGDESRPVNSCTETLDDHIDQGGDCDDSESAVNPGAAEVCNDGLDNDCDGSPRPCGLSGTADFDDAEAVFYGDYKEAGFGANGIGVGDLDGDGSDDFVLGSGTVGFWNGAASGLPFYVGYGQVGGTSVPGLTEIPNSSDLVAGADAAGLDDADGDGNRELLVGAPAGIGDGGTGAAYLFFVPPKSGASLTGSAVAILGSSTDLGATGVRVADVGDLDGDGRTDFAVASPFEHDPATYFIDGRVGIFTQPPISTKSLDDAHLMIYGAEDEWLGMGLAGVGDTNGDGQDDLLLGAPGGYEDGLSFAGKGVLVLGPVPSVLEREDADAFFLGDTDDAYFGGSASAAGDANSDGYQDFWLGGFGTHGTSSKQGHVRLYLGPIDPNDGLDGQHALVYGRSSGDTLGWSMDGTGDFDNDGHTDLIVGAMEASGGGSSGDGSAYVFYGPITGTWIATDAGFIVGPRGNDGGVGALAVSAGDTNGDGVDDLLIGAPGSTQGGADLGAAALFWGQGL